MKLKLFLTPVDAPVAVADLDTPATITEVLRGVEAQDWFPAGGRVLLDGVLIAPDTWDCTVLDPALHREAVFIGVPQGKKTFAILATVAVVAAAAFVSGGALGPAGLGFLGASFGAGGVGATLAASAITIAGSLAVSALTAPPKAGNDAEQRTITDAGVSGNALSLLETLPVIFGTVGYSPPLLAPPYTTLDGDDTVIHMIVGVEGRCQISNIRINDIAAADVAGITLETVEYTSDDTVFATYPKTVIEERSSQSLTNFKTELVGIINDVLKDQMTPDNSKPEWHYMQTAGDCKKAVFRYLFNSGMIDGNTGTEAVMPLRTEIKRKGDASWRALPTAHFSDPRKATGPMHAEVCLLWEKQPSGAYVTNGISSSGVEYPIVEITNITGYGQAFEYRSDPYFIGTEPYSFDSILPVMTAATTSGYTISASSEFAAANAGWKLSDSTVVGGTWWRPTANSLPAWVQFDLPAPVTVKGFQIVYDVLGVNYAATQFYWEAWDGAAWVRIDDVDHVTDASIHYWGHIANPMSSSKYRFNVVANNGAANQDVRIYLLRMFNNDVRGRDVSGGGCIHAASPAASTPRCINGEVTETGATFYLDPAEWPIGTYDIRVMRGAAFRESLFDYPSYAYNTLTANGDFFEYRLTGGKYKIFVSQKNIRSDCVIEAFQTIDDALPFTQSGLSVIALSAPNIQISSIFAEFTRYAPSWTGTEWTEAEAPTSNPASLYRQVLLGGANKLPADGDVIDEDALAAWYDTCVAKGYEAHAVMQGGTVGDALQMLATAGYAAPRFAETYGIVEDRDTGADPVSMAITPLNSQDQGTTQTLIDVPDFIRAEFNDAALKYAVNHIIVYRDGVTASTAKRGQTVTYTGWRDATKVAARATFDLKQAVARQVRYRFRMGIEGFLLRRGGVVQVINDVIDRAVAVGRIVSVSTSAGTVTGVTLDNVMPYASGGDLANVTDLESMADWENPSQAYGVFIRVPGSAGVIAQVTEVTDGNTCTFATPITDDGSIVPGLIVGAGPMGRIGRRCKVMSIQPEGFEARIVELADEATELFA